MSHATFDRSQPIAAVQPEARRYFATTPVLAVAGVTAAIHLVLSIGGGYWLDEVYMLTAGRYHLDWGYVDQPPVVPLLAAAMDWIAPGNYLVLRLPAVLATGAAVLLTALITAEFGGDRRAQLLASGACATGVWSAIVGHWLTTYTIEPTLWLTLTWLLVRWIRLRDDRLLLVFAAVVGVTIQTKFQILILGAVVLAGVLVFGPRELLRRPKLWAGAGIAALIGLPTLLWQALHGWPQLGMGAVVAEESSMLFGGRPGTMIWTVLFAGLAGTGLLLYGLWRLLFSVEFRNYRFLGIAFVVLYVFFVATLARPYYLTGLYGIGIAAGAVGLQHRRYLFGGRGNWIAWPAYTLSVVVALFAAGSLSLSGGAAITPWLPTDKAVARKTAFTYHQLPTETRAHTAILGGDYTFASYVDAYAQEYRIPNTHSPHRGYGYFGPPSERAESVLWVGPDPQALRPYFGEIRQLSGGQAPLWLCTGRTAEWQHIWPRITHL